MREHRSRTPAGDQPADIAAQSVGKSHHRLDGEFSRPNASLEPRQETLPEPSAPLELVLAETLGETQPEHAAHDGGAEIGVVALVGHSNTLAPGSAAAKMRGSSDGNGRAGCSNGICCAARELFGFGGFCRPREISAAEIHAALHCSVST